ncbi:MAG: 1,4-dihydroxy-2-naphthoate octaprenyltransferase [Candidatus Margulisiibacteriota bacterium]
MAKNEQDEKIRACLNSIEFGVVSTVEDGIARSRTMHFAQDENFIFYLASVKGDPKIRQIIQNPAVDLLLIKGNPSFPCVEEVEVTGTGEVLRSEEDRARAFNLLENKSPIVANMKQAGATGMLEAVRVVPTLIKHRKVEEIMRGVGPTVKEFEKKGGEVSHNYFVWENLKNKLAAWITEIRAPFLAASVIPVFLGAAIAWSRAGVFDANYFILTLLGIVFLHIGTNVANDYFDHKSGNDEANVEYVRPFSGGSRMIQKKLLTPKEVLAAALLFFALGSLIGLYLTWARGPVILILGLIGVFSGYFYSAPPFRLAGRGIGEVIVGLNFGTLVVLGAYFVQAQSLSWEAAAASLPVSFLIAAVLYINEFPDFNADKAVGKDNLVVRLGKEKAVLGYIALIWAVYVSIILGVIFKVVSPFALLIFLTVPRAMRAVRIIRANFNDTLFLIPANADTVLLHLYAGIALSIGYLLQKIFLGWF